MLKLLIILLGWIVPGVILFLYLLWISKRFAPTLDEQEAPVTPAAPAQPAESDLFAKEAAQPDRRAFEHWDAAR